MRPCGIDDAGNDINRAVVAADPRLRGGLADIETHHDDRRVVDRTTAGDLDVSLR